MKIQKIIKEWDCIIMERLVKKEAITHCNYSSLKKSSKTNMYHSLESISTVMHNHVDFYEIILILSGEWEHTIYGNTSTIFPGTLLFLYPGSTHQLFTNTPQSTHFVLSVEKSHFEKTIFGVFPRLKPEDFSNFWTGTISNEKLKYIEQTLHHLPKDPKKRYALSVEFLFLTVSEFLYQDDVADYVRCVKDITKKLDRFIYLNLSINEICAFYPYSPSVLLQYFKKITGKTMIEYKSCQKMKYAALLLSERDIKIIDIANRLQYNSLSYFLSTFKKTYGMTPSQYRKKHLPS